MGKNFKEFWKRQIAKILAVTMTLSTLCSAGVPIVHAATESECTPVDGRIISETAMEMITAGGSWTDSFSFTKDVLETIFGTSVATFEGTNDTIDLAKDVNSLTEANDGFLLDHVNNIENGGTPPTVILSGNNKEMKFRMMICRAPFDDRYVDNYVPVVVNGKSYAELVSNYFSREGALINRDGMLSIGLGAYASSADLDSRFGHTFNDLSGVQSATTSIAESTMFVGKTYSVWKEVDGFHINNLPYMGANEYSEVDDIPAIMFVPYSVQGREVSLTVEDVAAPGVAIPATVEYVTSSGTVLNTGDKTSEKVVATATLPRGYKWHADEDGVVEFGYWDTSAVVYVQQVDYNLSFSVVDKYDSSVSLPEAVLTLQQNVNGEWQDHSTLDNWQLSETQVAAMRSAADTSNYMFRVINSDAHSGYVIDTSVVEIDTTIGKTVTKQFQETAKYSVIVSNIANDGNGMANAQYLVTYGDSSKTLTLDANGYATTIFHDTGSESVTVQRLNTIDGYIRDEDTVNRTYLLSNDFQFDDQSDSFALYINDNDKLYNPPKYNHDIHISVVDEANTELNGVTIGIYTDAECTIPAVLEDGTAIPAEMLVTRGAGNIRLPAVATGVYYVKMTKSVKGYSDNTFDPTNMLPTSVFVVTVEDTEEESTLIMGVQRQCGAINLVFQDENNNPIPYVLCEITAKYDPNTYDGLLPENETVFYDYTNESGAIYAAQVPTYPHGLLNGIYTVKILDIPEGYIPPEETELTFDLSWQESQEFISLSQVVTLNTYKTYTFDVDIIDETTTKDALYSRYTTTDDVAFKNAYNDSVLPHVAYLTKGKDVVLTITASSDLSVMVNGTMHTIPAGTRLLDLPLNGATSASVNYIYFTPENGEPIAVNIPEGVYKFTLNEPGTGYAFKDPYYEISTYDMGNESRATVTMRQLMQFANTTVNKTDKNSNSPISNITFALMNVDVLSVHGLDISDTTLTNKDVSEFLQTNNLAPRFVAQTNDSGTIDFGLVPYGTYWLIEMYDAISADYEITTPKVVVVNDSTAIVENITNTSKLAYIQITNDDAIQHTVIANAQFELRNGDALDDTMVTNNSGNAISNQAYMNGEFVIKNIVTADGYVLADDVIVTAVNGVWTQETANGSVVLDRVWDSAFNKWIVNVNISNVQNKLTVQSYFGDTLLQNVEYTIYDEDGNVVFNDETQSSLVYNGLPAGTYYIAQTAIPGYVTLPKETLVVDNVTPEYTVTFNNEQTLVTVKTLDGIGGWELDGVVVEMYQGDTLIATFDDEHKSHVGIPAGTYTLITDTMPNGYQAPSANIEIVVQDIAGEQVFINNVVSAGSDPDGDTVVYEDNRTYGTFGILKLDSVTKTPLKNINFSLRYAEDLIIDGVAITAGTEVAQLVTDDNGQATLATPVLIAVYSQNGVQPIVYTLVETELPVGQYVQGAASADLSNIVFEYKDDATPLITLSEIQINNDRPNITVTATSDPETRLYDENGVVVGNEYLTVVENGQEITFTIEVANNGTATGYDIDVRDILPGEFVVTNVDTGSFTIHNGNAYWHIPELPAGQKVQLVLKAKVNVDGATLIDNKIEWTMPETPYETGEGVDKEDENVEWNTLPTFQYHVVVFASSASKDTLVVSAFDTITLHYHFKAIDELTDFRMTDVIPEGLTYVEGSAQLNGEQYEDVVFDEETRTIEFLAPEEWSNDMTFSFTVKVDYIQNGDEHEWKTDAKATFLANAYTMKEMVIVTKKVTILADSIMNVEFDTDIETFIGDVDKADGLTVLQKGDNVCYTVYIYNDGISKLKNVMIKDVLPDNLKIVDITTDMNGLWYYAKGQDVVWFLASIAPGEVVELDVTATVKEQVAGTLANNVRYDVMRDIPAANADGSIVIPEFKNTSRTTDTAIYQVLEFHKAAEINGKASNNENVAIGDVLVYTMNITAADLVRGVKVIDKLPKGVSFVPGSAQIKLANDTDWTDIPDALVFDKATNTIKFATNADATTVLDADAGSNYFRFSVTVDRIGTNNANANNYNKATFTNTASLEYRAIVDDEDSVKTLASEAITHMTEISVTGGKSGSVDTYEGVYADRKYVTVVANGDELKFDISIKNSGANALTDVVVQDVVPANSTLVTKDGDNYTHKDGVLTWVIPEIKADETATVSFTVKVAAPADKAVEVVNQAKYAVPADVNNIKASEWIETNSVVYQVISIKMSSSVAGGTDATDAKTVEIGSTITYTITVECVDDIYGLNLSNKIPEGMEFVQDSAKMKIGEGEATVAKFTLDGNTITFAEFDEIKAGKLAVSFDVKVKDTTEYDKAVVFINQADVSLKPAKDAEKDIVMKTNPISHTTKKTNATDTPKLGLETTNASLVWGLITMVALAGMCVFGYFGFIEPRKKRKD